MLTRMQKIAVDQVEIAGVCDELKELLLEKNRAYGSSALDPVRIFSQVSSEAQLLVRIDDKISRVVHGGEFGEDVVQDLIGYLILLRIVRDRAKRGREEAQTHVVTRREAGAGFQPGVDPLVFVKFKGDKPGVKKTKPKA